MKEYFKCVCGASITKAESAAYNTFCFSCHHQFALLAKNEKIDHPPHYTSHPSGVECIDIAEHMNFNIGNAVKYLWRCSLKNALIEDLKKARWYIDREISRLEGKK